MGVINKTKSFTDHTTEEFTSETLEIIKMIVKYEKEIEKKNQEIAEYWKEYDNQSANYKNLRDSTLNDLEEINTYFSHISKKMTKKQLCEALDHIHNCIYDMMYILRN